MVRLLDFLWRLMSLVGLVLSLRRWWRTVTDHEAEPQERAMAAGILLFMLALVILSVLNFGGPRTAANPATEPQVAASAPPPVTELVVVSATNFRSGEFDRWMTGSAFRSARTAPTASRAVDWSPTSPTCRAGAEALLAELRPTRGRGGGPQPVVHDARESVPAPCSRRIPRFGESGISA